MSTLEDVKRYVETIEARAEERGWDQPATLFRLFFDWDSGEMSSAIVPLQFMHAHAPTACDILGDLLEQGALPLEVWPKVGEIALVVMHEAWMARPDRGPQEFQDEYDRINREYKAHRDRRRFNDDLDAVYTKHYGKDFSFADIPGSDEIRGVAVLVGKKALMYHRVRGEQPRWLGDNDGEWTPFGNLHDAMLSIQRASRVPQAQR